MSRPPLWLWMLVVAFGGVVIADDLRRDNEISEMTALRARVTAAERQLREGCFILRSPYIVEAKR